jgi:hypothetical protein
MDMFVYVRASPGEKIQPNQRWVAMFTATNFHDAVNNGT